MAKGSEPLPTRSSKETSKPFSSMTTNSASQNIPSKTSLTTTRDTPSLNDKSGEGPTSQDVPIGCALLQFAEATAALSTQKLKISATQRERSACLAEKQKFARNGSIFRSNLEDTDVRVKRLLDEVNVEELMLADVRAKLDRAVKQLLQATQIEFNSVDSAENDAKRDSEDDDAARSLLTDRILDVFQTYYGSDLDHFEAQHENLVSTVKKVQQEVEDLGADDRLAQVSVQRRLAKLERGVAAASGRIAEIDKIQSEMQDMTKCFTALRDSIAMLEKNEAVATAGREALVVESDWSKAAIGKLQEKSKQQDETNKEFFEVLKAKDKAMTMEYSDDSKYDILRQDIAKRSELLVSNIESLQQQMKALELRVDNQERKRAGGDPAQVNGVSSVHSNVHTVQSVRPPAQNENHGPPSAQYRPIQPNVNGPPAQEERLQQIQNTIRAMNEARVEHSQPRPQTFASPTHPNSHTGSAHVSQPSHPSQFRPWPSCVTHPRDIQSKGLPAQATSNRLPAHDASQAQPPPSTHAPATSYSNTNTRPVQPAHPVNQSSENRVPRTHHLIDAGVWRAIVNDVQNLRVQHLTHSQAVNTFIQVNLHDHIVNRLSLALEMQPRVIRLKLQQAEQQLTQQQIVNQQLQNEQAGQAVLIDTLVQEIDRLKAPRRPPGVKVEPASARVHGLCMPGDIKHPADDDDDVVIEGSRKRRRE